MRHELAIASKGVMPALIVTLIVSLIALVSGGAWAGASALAGAALIAANHALAALSAGATKTFDMGVAAFVWATWMIRMFAVVMAFAFLSTFTHRGWTAAGFVAALVVSLAWECASYARGTYVPAWRTIR